MTDQLRAFFRSVRKEFFLTQNGLSLLVHRCELVLLANLYFGDRYTNEKTRSWLHLSENTTDVLEQKLLAFLVEPSITKLNGKPAWLNDLNTCDCQKKTELMYMKCRRFNSANYGRRQVGTQHWWQNSSSLELPILIILFPRDGKRGRQSRTTSSKLLHWVAVKE